jgi:hypothetical protein
METKMNHFLTILLVAFLLLTGLPAQLHLGADAYSTTEMVNASGAETNNEAKLDRSGTDILVGNGFGVYMIVEIRSASGELLFSTTVAPNNLVLGPHQIPSGEHNVLACDAGSPPPKKCGTVCVK